MREKSKHQNFSMARFEKNIFAVDVHVLGQNATAGMQQPYERCIHPLCLANCDICNGSTRDRMGKVADFNALNSAVFDHPHRCGRCGFEPRTGHMQDKQSSTCGCVRWSSWSIIFSLHLPIGSSRYE